MKILVLIAALFLFSCSGTTELPTAGTMETGDTVRTPRQYEEFCERDTNDVCPEADDADSNN